MSEFDVLSPAQQSDIIKQYGSLAAARAAMEAPAPPPAGAPVAPPATAPAAAPPAPKVDDINAGPITPEEAARYGATPRQVALSAAGPSNPDESWEQKQARLKSYGPTPDVGPAAPPLGPAATAAAAAPVDGNKYAKAPGEAAGAATTPGINWGGTGGGGVIPAHEQPVVSAKRQGELLGAIDKQKDAIDEEGRALAGQQTAAGAVADANANVETQRGVGEIDQAKAALGAGQDIKDRAKQAAEEAKVYRDRINEFSEKLAKDKINPNGMWDNASVPQKITWTIAKMLGAVGQSFLHLPTNQVADELERMAAQDVATQRANHEIGRERVADMNTLYGQALHATGNAEEAQRVATGYAMEAVKHQAQALVSSAQGAKEVAKGKEFIADIGARIAANGERKAIVDEKKAEKGIAMNPLVQAHAAGGVDMKTLGKDMDAYLIKMAELGQKVTPDEAFRYAVKKNTGRDPQPGAGPFVQGVKGDPANKEQRETQVATDEFNRQIDDLRKHPVITGSGLGTAIGAQLPQRVAPDSNDAQQQLNAINTRMLQAIGKVAKDADGKPNKTMIEKIEKNFEIHLGDSPAIKQQKLQGVADVYNSLAREQGAKAPEPTKGPPPGMTP